MKQGRSPWHPPTYHVHLLVVYGVCLSTTMMSCKIVIDFYHKQIHFIYITDEFFNNKKLQNIKIKIFNFNHLKKNNIFNTHIE